MPRSTVLDLVQKEQAQMLAALRRARYGYLLALHILLLCAAGALEVPQENNDDLRGKAQGRRIGAWP